MMDERYRDELNQIRLTQESRADLTRALADRQGKPAQRPRRRWSRTAVAAAVVAAILVGSVGAAVVVPPVVRSYFGDSAGYRQSAVELGQSIIKNGWTMTLTDCMADDYTIYLGVTLTAPEGTVLDDPNGYHFMDPFMPDFDLPGLTGTGTYHQVDDGNPTDNQVSFLFFWSYFSQAKSLNGQTLEFTLGELYHDVGWTAEGEYSIEKIYDCYETWSFRTTLNYPDHIIRLEPDVTVHTLGVDADVTEVTVSPLSVYVLLADDTLGLHHQNPPLDAEGYPACTAYQEIILYTKDGTAIPLMHDSQESGCDEGTWILPCDWDADPSGGERGWLRFIRRPDTPLDVENLASISVCGVVIPLNAES